MATDGSVVEIFRLTMSRNYVQFVIAALRVYDEATRQQRNSTDKLTVVKEYLDFFVANWKSGYSMWEYATVDKRMRGFDNIFHQTNIKWKFLLLRVQKHFKSHTKKCVLGNTHENLFITVILLETELYSFVNQSMTQAKILHSRIGFLANTR